MSEKSLAENFNEWAAQYVQKPITEQKREINLTAKKHEINWGNIELETGLGRALNILDPYSFHTLLLEIHCNLPEINSETVKAQFREQIHAKTEEAWEIFYSNLDNIVKYAQKERDS